MRYCGALSQPHASVTRWAIHSAVGCAVTPSHRMRLRSCRRTSNPYSSRNEIVGTTNRSIEAIPSAWFRRNVSPALRWWAPMSGHVLGNRSLADIDAELEEFSMDARSAPEGICQADLADQLPNFERHLGPAGSPSRLPAPEAAESSTMPSHNRLRPNDCHRIKNRRREPI